MKFCWTTLRVNNLQKSLDFYQEIVGLKVERSIKTEEGAEIVFLGQGETKLELVYDNNKKEVNVGDDISIGFEVESLSDKLDFIRGKGMELHSGPFQPNPHIKFFFITDPNGLRVQFVENL